MPIYLSVIIPVYNEEQRVGKTLAAVQGYLARQAYVSEVLLIDDGSSDSTRGVISTIIQGWSNYKLLVNPENRGKGAVVKQGMLIAQGEYILFTDADNATPIAQIEKLLPYINKYPIVIGSRHCPGAKIHVSQSPHRMILSRLSNLLIRWLAVPGIYDTQCGFKLFKNKPAKDIFSRVTINRFGFDFEALAIARHLGYQFKEVGVDWYNDGASKVRAGRDAIRTLRDLLKVKGYLLSGVYDQPAGHPEVAVSQVADSVAASVTEEELLEKISD